jgi:hypothetical protein
VCIKITVIRSHRTIIGSHSAQLLNVFLFTDPFGVVQLERLPAEMYRPRESNTPTHVGENCMPTKDLDASLHESCHGSSRRSPRRRLSLDNSCLATPDTAFRSNYLYDMYRDEDIDRYPQHRRLSLNNRTQATEFFLAGPQSLRRDKMDLDKDMHDSLHSKESTEKFSSHHDSASSWDSDGDSFCEASVEDQANREYLHQESFFWRHGSSDEFDFDDSNHGPASHLVKGPAARARPVRQSRSDDQLWTESL